MSTRSHTLTRWLQKVGFWIVLIGSTTAQGLDDLTCLYQLALEYDPTLQAAKALELAGKEARPQALAALLPILQAGGQTTGAHSSQYQSYNNHDYGVTLTQPLFHFSRWQNFLKAGTDVQAAVATYAAAEQTLITELTQKYFAILSAQDNLEFATSERKAFARFLEQTRQRFKVGLIAITDVHEAQARHDSAYAKEISSKNQLTDQFEIMATIVGRPVHSIQPLRKQIHLNPPEPMNIEHWVKQATEQNFNLLAKRYLVKSARHDIHAKASGHLPTVQMTGSVNRSRQPPPVPQFNRTESIGFNLTVPIFAGGSVLSETRRSRHLYEHADEEYEAVYRKTVNNTRQAYRGMLTLISQVRALKQAVLSSTSALQATKAAFDVGTRTMVDVLDAQTAVLAAERDYRQAHYQYIIQSLKLKEAAGNLSMDDVLLVNALLNEPAPPKQPKKPATKGQSAKPNANAPKK